MWKVNVRLQALLPRSTLAEQNALAAASGHERTFIFAARLLEAMAAPLAELQSARRAGALNETDAKALSLIEASHTQLTSGLTEGSVDRLRSAVASLRAFNERFDQTAPIHQTTTDFELEVGRVRPKNRERFEESLRATAQKTPAPASTGAAASSFDTGATARASPPLPTAPLLSPKPNSGPGLTETVDWNTWSTPAPTVRLFDVVPNELVAQELKTADLPVDMLNNAGITVDPTFVDAQTQTVASMRLGPSDHSRLQAVLHPASPEQALRQRLRTLVLTDPQRSFVSLEGAVAELSARGLTEATIELPFENTDALDYADLALGILNRRRGTNFTARLASGKAGELGLVTVGGVAARLAKAEATNSAGAPRAADLERRLLDSLPKVKELRFLTQLARESGVRVWVAGGSAAKLSFYTKWAIEAERGLKPFQKERFDFEYANIFLPAAPLELIVDGPAAAVTSFKQRANERLAYAQPTIDTLPEFASKAHQVNDAASLAVELTEGATTRIVQIEPNARLSPSTFLDQVVDDHVRLRADAPLTPDGILLHLIDLSRNGLLPDDAEISALGTAVGQIDGAYPVSKGVVPKAERMLGEALDVEQTFALLDALGVRAKLLERGEGDRLAVSFDKQPLQTTDLEQTDPSKWVGPMAAFASHRTKSFDGYASMTSNPSGKPNFLVSRRSNHWGALGDKFGENAAYLPKDREFAFYAMRGDAGINGTEQSFDVRMMIDPRATAGDLDAMSQYNGGLRLYSNAAKIRFQNPTLDFARFFEGIADGSLRSALGDAALNILRRKLKSESLVLDEQATQRLLGWVEEQALHSQREGRTSPLVGEAILTNLAVREDTLNRWNSLGLMTREVKKVLGSLDSSRLPWLQSLLRD